jgi:hypothetical protein
MIERCVRCGAPAGIKMAFAYEPRLIWLEDLTGAVVPGLEYPLCESHADRLTPPVGWSLIDHRRPIRPLFAAFEVA